MFRDRNRSLANKQHSRASGALWGVSRRRTLRLEPLEDRRLLAVDFGNAPETGSTSLVGDDVGHETVSPILDTSVVPPSDVSASSAAASGSSSRYMIWYDWGGTWHDAEKSPNNGEDDLMCWAAAASNVLAWTGWGPLAGYTSTDSIFAQFQNHWTDDGGWTDRGWDWWFEGDGWYTNPTTSYSYVDVPWGGGFFPGTNVSTYRRDSPDAASAMQTIRSCLDDGFGAEVGVKTSSTHHAITCWGYDYSPANEIVGLWITNSDDDKSDSKPENELQYYEVEQRANQSWYLLDVGQSFFDPLGWFSGQDWEIRSVRGLKRFDGDLVLSGTSGGDDFHVQRQAEMVEIHDSSGDRWADASYGLLDSITVNGSSDDDTMIVNFSGDNPIPPDGLTFNGETEGALGDSLTIEGTADTIVHRETGFYDGMYTIDGSRISYEDTQAVVDNMSALNRAFNFSVGNATIGQSPAGGPGVMQVSFPGGQTVDFSNPSNSLTLRAADFLTIDGTIQDFGNNLTLNVVFWNTEITAPIGGAGGLTKIGRGTLTLSAANSYSGDTVVTEGRLDVNGSIDSASAVTIGSGAMLGGTGTVTGQVHVEDGATLAPGLSPGILNSGSVHFQQHSTFEVEIGGNTPGEGLNHHDQLVVTGSVEIDNNVTLDTKSFGNYLPTFGDSFVLIDNDQGDAVVGTFSGLPEGAVVSTDFLSSGRIAHITYQGGDGNDVVIAIDGFGVESLTTTPSTLTDSAAGTGTFTVTVVFSETMDTTATPSLVFDPDVVGTADPTLSNGVGVWSTTVEANDTYTVTYDVADRNIEISDIEIDVTGAENAVGAAQADHTPEAEFSIDTLNPSVADVTAGPSVLVDAHVGTGTFTVTVVFSETMDTATVPSLLFNPDVVGTGAPTLSNAAGTWSTTVEANDTYTVTYDVTDQSVTLQDVEIGVAVAKDASGNEKMQYTPEAEFSVDTRNPIVTDVIAGPSVITDAHAGTDTFTVTVVFSETMDTSLPPFLAFTPDVFTTATPTLSNGTGAWSTTVEANDTYTETYDVTDQNVTLLDIEIDVVHVKDVAGNEEKPYTPEAEFSIEMNLPPGITVDPALGLTTTEAGGKATFTVVLDSDPAADVTITVSSDDTTEGTVPSTSLTFAPGNWSQPQAVTVTGVDDNAVDGDVAYSIVLTATSGDTEYNTLAPANVVVTNEDNEAIVPVELGLVDFKLLESLDPAVENLWFRMETSHAGWLTIESVQALTAAQLSLGLFDPSNLATPLATSSPSDPTPRIDYEVDESQVYLLRVAGSAPDAQVRLANLVHELAGAVTVYGTDLDDEFVFDAAASREITINGVAYHRDDTEVATVDFNGGDGTDTVWLRDSAGDENLEAWPDRATFVNGPGDAVQDFSVDAIGIEHMLAYAAQGGTDSGLLHGSARGDKFKSNGNYAFLRGKSTTYSLRAEQFDSIAADSGTAGKDVAVFNGSDADETFTFSGDDNSARLQSNGRDHMAQGFTVIIARAGEGQDDVAHFTDTPGQEGRHDDVFYFKSHKTQLVGADVKVTARAFDEVHATGDQGGFDVARFCDTTGDDHLEIDGDTVRLYRRIGNQLDLLYEAVGFERVKAYSTEGDDTKDIQSHSIADLLLYGWDT